MGPGKLIGKTQYFDIETAEIDRAAMGFLLVGNNEVAEKLIEDAVDTPPDQWTRKKALMVVAGNIALVSSSSVPKTTSNIPGLTGLHQEKNEFLSSDAQWTILKGIELLGETAPALTHVEAAS